MLFVLVEPSKLSAEGKKRMADWLCEWGSGVQKCSLVMILTSPWHIPAAAQAQPLHLRNREKAQQMWKQESPEVFIYHGAPWPKGAGSSSGKSLFIRGLCHEHELVQCIVHEGFQAKHFLTTASQKMLRAKSVGRQIAFHIDLSAYSDFDVANNLLRNLLLCRVLYDASIGQMLPVPKGATLHVEIGSLAGKRDLHSLKSYATEELLQSKFPAVSKEQLNLKLIYPILDIVGKEFTNQVKDAKLQCEAEDKVEEIFSDDEETNEVQPRLPKESLSLALRLMYAFLQPHPLEGPDSTRRLIDLRPSELEQLQAMGVRADLAKLYRNSFAVDLRQFPDPPNVEGTLEAFASHFGLNGELNKARTELILSRLSILADFMSKSHLFKSTEHPSMSAVGSRMGSLLVECVGVGLKKLSHGEDICIHFVPTYTGHSRDDFQFFLPSLVAEAGDERVCPRGAACDCNRLRRQLLQELPHKLLIADPDAADVASASLKSALEDEMQGIQALSCAFGIEVARIKNILEQEGVLANLRFCLTSISELLTLGHCCICHFRIFIGHRGYVLTRDFTSRILELLARWHCRSPVILVGESGTGKTRALQLLTQLLLDSQHVRPDICKDLYDWMRAKLRKAKEGHPADPVLRWLGVRAFGR